jgi:hypothetical protein
MTQPSKFKLLITVVKVYALSPAPERSSSPPPLERQYLALSLELTLWLLAYSMW